MTMRRAAVTATSASRFTMRFDLHRSMRWAVDVPEARFESLYRRAVKEYYAHLSRLRFSRAATLLRYFGDSFFHDAEILSLLVRPDESTLELRLFTLNDLEDINDYQRARGIALIGKEQYRRSPVLYACTFRRVTDLRARVTSLHSVIDTELDRGQQPGKLCVRISFGEHDGISFECAGCTVTVEWAEPLTRLMGRLQRIPRCHLCRSRLLTAKKVQQVLHRTRGHRGVRAAGASHRARRDPLFRRRGEMSQVSTAKRRSRRLLSQTSGRVSVR